MLYDSRRISLYWYQPPSVIYPLANQYDPNILLPFPPYHDRFFAR